MADIGKPVKEVEVTPISVPVPEPAEPAEEPKRELQPA